MHKSSLKSQATTSPDKSKSIKPKTYRIPKSTLKGKVVVSQVNKEMEKEIGIILLNNYRNIKMHI